ncbi:MAG TPA: chemotaxis protein CheW [Acetobacteraceae bacterium]
MQHEQAAAAVRRRELIAFRIGEQEFCVDIMVVREIRGWTPATPLPRAPGFVRGVINLRGAVLPIVDLAARLGFMPREAPERQVIIVAQIANGAATQIVGLQVDAVSDILTVEDGTLQPPPDVASELVRNFVQGLLAIEGRMVSLVSLDRILPRQDLAA